MSKQILSGLLIALFSSFSLAKEPKSGRMPRPSEQIEFHVDRVTMPESFWKANGLDVSDYQEKAPILIEDWRRQTILGLAKEHQDDCVIGGARLISQSGKSASISVGQDLSDSPYFAGSRFEFLGAVKGDRRSVKLEFKALVTDWIEDWPLVTMLRQIFPLESQRQVESITSENSGLIPPGHSLLCFADGTKKRSRAKANQSPDRKVTAFLVTPKIVESEPPEERIGLHIVAISTSESFTKWSRCKSLFPEENEPRLLSKRQAMRFMEDAQGDRRTDVASIPDFFLKSGERCEKQLVRKLISEKFIQKVTLGSMDIRATASSDWSATTLEFEAKWNEPTGTTYSLRLDQFGFPYVYDQRRSCRWSTDALKVVPAGWSLLMNLGTLISDDWRNQINWPLAGNVEFIDRMVSKVLPVKEPGKTIYLLVTPFGPGKEPDYDIIAGRLRYYPREEEPAPANGNQSVRNLEAVAVQALSPSKPLDLRPGESRLIGLTRTPSDIVIENSELLDYSLVTPNLLQLHGGKPGTTVMTMWFRNPKDENKLDPISYLVRILPEPKPEEGARSQMPSNRSRRFEGRDIHAVTP